MSREIDRLVAVHVCEQKIFSKEEMEQEAKKVWKEQPLCTGFAKGFTAWRNEEGIHTEQKFKPYSSDIAAAWEVVKKSSMPFLIHKSYKERHGEGVIGYKVNWCAEKYCPCQDLGEGADCEHGNEIWAETAPLAIALAALKAKGVEVEG